MPLVAIALGSNLGDRHAHLQWAFGELSRLLRDAKMSSAIETAPVDVPDPQPPYLNAAVVGETTMAAPDLLHALLALEKTRGRVRHTPRAARTLDLDLILYGDMIIDTPELTLPHPRFTTRAFVLDPLIEIAPSLRDPQTGLTIADLGARLTPRS